MGSNVTAMVRVSLGAKSAMSMVAVVHPQLVESRFMVSVSWPVF